MIDTVTTISPTGKGLAGLGGLGTSAFGASAWSASEPGPASVELDSSGALVTATGSTLGSTGTEAGVGAGATAVGVGVGVGTAGIGAGGVAATGDGGTTSDAAPAGLAGALTSIIGLIGAGG